MGRDIFYVMPVGGDFEVVGQPHNYSVRFGWNYPRRIAFCTHKRDAECIAEALNYMENIDWKQPSQNTGEK